MAARNRRNSGVRREAAVNVPPAADVGKGMGVIKVRLSGEPAAIQRALRLLAAAAGPAGGRLDGRKGPYPNSREAGGARVRRAPFPCRSRHEGRRGGPPPASNQPPRCHPVKGGIPIMTLSELAATLEARLNGPHADEDTAAIARLAAEAVRYLNYATMASPGLRGFEWPVTGYRVAGNLSGAAHGMPQLFEQITRRLAEQHAGGLLAVDGGGDVAEVIAAATARLEEAARLASRLGYELGSLQSVLSGLNGRGPNRRLDDEDES
jgi:hypothetical protein